MDGKTYGNACAARCAQVDVSHKGECSSCNDSDGGKNISEKGTASSPSGSITDSCKSDRDLEEAFCDGNDARSETLGCPSTQECKGGACVLKTVAAPLSCEDSDFGQEYYVPGSVKSGGLQYNDVCTGLTTLKEYYCEGGAIRDAIHPCQSGERCENGRCAVPDRVCTETDGGNDIYNKGTLTSGSVLSETTRTDSCSDSNTVREYYCTGSDFASELRDCPSGYECQNGECREEDCDDTDGTSIYSAGTVTRGAAIQSDYCTSGSGGIEYRCSGNDIASSPFTCPGGYSCSGGRCISSPTCTDTDGGTNEVVAGTATDSTGSSADYCASGTSVGEYYCSGALKQSTVIVCLPGEICSAGACIVPCTDSDGSANEAVAGTTTDSTGSSNDFCASPTSVGEYYCVGNTRQSTTISCLATEVCSGGACVVTCSDSDGGEEPFVFGTASDSSGTYDDYCATTSKVIEHYCSSGMVVTNMIICDLGCSSGVCMIP
jgi:hypothetical protein